MKPVFSSVVSLLLGLVIGIYASQSRAKQETTQIVKDMLDATESSDAAEATRDVRAIDLIESGDTTTAVQLLSRPAANYYCEYSGGLLTNDHRVRSLVIIHEAASTNEALADAIAESRGKSLLPP